MRKIRILLFSGALLLALAAPALAANSPEDVRDWNDVPDWARQQVEDVLRWEIMTGYPVQPGDAFHSEWRPGAPITVAEFATILARALDENGQGAPPAPFRDVPQDSWFAPYVNGLTKAGIIKPEDYPDGDLGAALPITRGEIATWVGRAAVREHVQPSRPDPGLTDLEGEKYRDEIVTAARTGIVEGYPDRTFRPGQPVTRAEAAVMIHRLVTQMTDNPPDVQLLMKISRQCDAILTWADQQRDWKYATEEVLVPLIKGCFGPTFLQGSVDERAYFLRRPIWYSERRHVEGQPILLGRTVAITIDGGLHRTKLDNGAWEVDSGWAARGWYTWYRRVNGRWLITSGLNYDPDPNSNLWQIPPFYHPERYNQGPSPCPWCGKDYYWGEDGVTVYDPGPNPPATARFGVTGPDGKVQSWEPFAQPWP